MGHRWDPRTLVCTGRGCEATWDSHQQSPAECEKKPTYRDGPAKRQRVSLREYRRCCITFMCMAGWTVREIKASLPLARSTIDRDLEDRGVKPARDNYRGGNPDAQNRSVRPSDAE
jgi:hypothetical protein